MTELNDISDDALRMEINRRNKLNMQKQNDELNEKIYQMSPRPVKDPDLSGVINMCKEYVQKRIDGEYIDEDFAVYLEETTMMAIMGSDVYARLKDIDNFKKNKQ